MSSVLRKYLGKEAANAHSLAARIEHSDRDHPGRIVVIRTEKLYLKTLLSRWRIGAQLFEGTQVSSSLISVVRPLLTRFL